MKREFSYYEFAGLIVPGAIVVSGIPFLFPGVIATGLKEGMGFGEFGLLLLVAYGAGHLLHAIGNLLETGWWWLIGRGMPTDWLRSDTRVLLTESQRQAVFTKMKKCLAVTLPEEVTTMPRKEWHAIVRQVYAEVEKHKAATRVDAFTGNYGINRGLAAAFVVLAGLSLLSSTDHGWRLYVALGVFFSLSMARMHRFGVHYGRELFVQFLATEQKAEETKGDEG